MIIIAGNAISLFSILFARESVSHSAAEKKHAHKMIYSTFYMAFLVKLNGEIQHKACMRNIGDIN